MTNQELIQEAAVIRDERNQYANTAERVGTALVHMAEQIAAQAADVDKIEADVQGALTLSQLDNPFGFTTVAQWMQGLRGSQSYTFRLVEPTTGRCIGHVWLFNDADNPSNSNLAARTLEVVMCCASINADTGALTYNAINGSPRIYYRSYCAPLTGGTPDGGPPIGNKWSLWQEYRDYVAKPIKEALAALQAKHATDVADLQANIDAAVASIPMSVFNIGMSADADTILSEAAKYAVASDPFKAVITGQYMVGTAVQSIVIHQQVTKSSNGSGVCMQYVYKDKARYARYINFNAAAKVTAVQGLQPDGVRNLYYTDTGFIGQRDAWGTQVGSGFFLPNKNDLREGTPTATSVPLVLTKAIKDTVTCNLGPATTARAGVMTVEQVKSLGALSNMWLEIEVEFTEIGDLVTYFSEHPDISLNDTYKFFCCRISNERSDYNVFGMKSVRPDADKTYAYVGLYIKYGDLYDVLELGFSLEDGQWVLDDSDICTPLRNVYFRYAEGGAFLVKTYSSEFIPTSEEQISTANTLGDGLMSAAHVKKLNELESRIAALEAKSK